MSRFVQVHSPGDVVHTMGTSDSYRGVLRAWRVDAAGEFVEVDPIELEPHEEPDDDAYLGD